MLYIIFDKILISEKSFPKTCQTYLLTTQGEIKKSKIFDKGLNDPKITYQIIGFQDPENKEFKI